MTIDARNHELKIREHCEVAGHRGEIIIVTDETTQLRVERPGQMLDLDRVAETAIRVSLEAAATLVSEAGGIASIEERDDLLG